MSRSPLLTYQKLSTEFYELERHRDHDVSLAFYFEQARLSRGPILEPMCGSGRFLIPLLQAGFDIEGFDASRFMLEACKEKCKRMGVDEPPVTQQFAQDFTSSRLYNLMFVPYGSWGLITNLTESKLGLERLYAHMAPGGKLFLEIETESSAPEKSGIWHRGINTLPDGSVIAVNARPDYDPETQLYDCLCRYELIKNSEILEVETQQFKMHLYRFNEMDQLLASVGFKDIKKYRDHQKNLANDLQAPLLIYECVK